ncbi:MAG: SDR family oxidoreductase [Bacteroidota bacterium]|nr:SDR family oxidoreductase [Bacteroidota bacterium]MDP4212796.1 SDR family oxidoreductase [Bacteroidota bacterium]MDP4250228.1 SDR family oxidoreductase [Bacteroidota bacterium]
MTIIITGASRGIGYALAESFAKEGHDLYLTASNEVNLYRALESLMGRFPDQRVKAKAFDLSSKEGAVGFGNWVLDQQAAVDVLVNNAGRFIPGSIYNEEDGVLEEMLAVNLMSAYHLTRVLLPSMIQRKSGHIFNLCSIAALAAYANGGSYSISKFALSGFSKNLREEMKPYGIKVTGIYPGAIYTDSWAGSGVDPNRIMKPSDIADTILQISKLSPQAVVEDLVIRPLLGDL